ncbi:DHS-like NAD/FAD-binding domain-containing protein [Syncephalis plumigaleata]|nr:DHS-like NAD/FAD-binding domain-containing protein [Syncephalis plumigaleata]
MSSPRNSKKDTSEAAAAAATSSTDTKSDSSTAPVTVITEESSSKNDTGNSKQERSKDKTQATSDAKPTSEPSSVSADTAPTDVTPDSASKSNNSLVTPPSSGGRSGRGPPKERITYSPSMLHEKYPERKIIADASLESIADLIKKGKAKKIIVMTGAGISTAAGIPDFRSPGTGLYDNLKKYDLPFAEAIFEIDYFTENPEPFYALAKELYPGNFKPTISHYFIRLLADRGLLLRQFTQNIDTLERRAGLADEYIVEAHGSFHSASCIECRKSADTNGLEQIFNSVIPRCNDCNATIKPDITFFGEALPERFRQKSQEDFKNCDMLLIMGTSLKVQPFCLLVDQVTLKTPRLLINRELVGSRQKYRRDAFYLAELLGFKVTRWNSNSL